MNIAYAVLNVCARLMFLLLLFPLGAHAAGDALALYSFDEGAGSKLLDLSGNGNTGILNNEPAWVDGKHDKALSFDGSNKFVNIADSPSLAFGSGDYTISAWVYPRALDGIAFLAKYGSTGNGWRLQFSPSGRLQFQAGGLTSYSSANLAKLNQWTHVAVVKSGGSVKLYVDAADRTEYGVAPASVDNTAPLQIGTTLPPPSSPCCQRYANVVMDDVRIYKRALTQADMQSDMNTIVADTTAPSAPQNLGTTILSTSDIRLSWSPSSDNVAVAGYKILRDGATIASVSAASYLDGALAPNTAYSYAVLAYDAAGNVSQPSATVQGRTLSVFDFSLANGGALSVTTGQSISNIVTATLDGGVSQDVSFSAAGLPAGVAASFSPASCALSCSSTITLKTASTTPPGAYQISISASAGALSRTAGFVLTVSSPAPAFDFSLQNGGNRSVTAGQSVTNGVNAALLAGAAQAVAFSTAGLPAGVTASFSAANCTPACSTTLTLQSTAGAVAGSYPISVTATGGGLSRNTSFTLTVAGGSTPAPTPKSYFVEYINPLSSSAFNRYSRSIEVPIVKGTVSLQTWLMDQGGGPAPCHPNKSLCALTTPSEMPTVWLTLDGVRITQALSHPYQSVLDTTKYADGAHVLSAEVRSNDGSKIYVVPLQVVFDNVPGGVSGPQKIPVCTTKFDFDYIGRSQGCEWLDYPGVPTFARAAPNSNPRVATLLESVPVSPKELWTEKIVASIKHGWLSRFYAMPGGHVTTAGLQNYFYTDLDNHNFAEMDGPRNVASLGYIAGGSVERYSGESYFILTNGRFVKVGLDGQVDTIAGWRVKPGQLPPYWKGASTDKAAFEAQYENVGNFIDGPKFLYEPWDVIVDPRDHKIWYVADSRNHRIAKIDEHTSPASISTFAGSLAGQAGLQDGKGSAALFNEPWNLAMDAAGNMYVSDRLNHAIRKIDPAGNVTTVFKSAVTPPPLQPLSNPGRSAKPPYGTTLAGMRSLYMISGDWAQATLAYPEGLRFDLQGRLVVAEGLTRVVRRIDLAARRIDPLANIPFEADMNTYNININLDDGSCGGKDDILIGTFAQGGPWRMKADGTYKSLQSNDLGPTEGRGDKQRIATYPWFAMCGRGALWMAGAGEGLFRMTKAKTTDPVLNDGRYAAGKVLYYNGTVPNFPERPGFHLRHSHEGQDQFGGEPFDVFGMRPDAEIRSMIQAGWGSSNGQRPEISGRDFDSLLYYIRSNCTPCIAAGKAVVPPAQADATAPQISKLTAVQVDAGTVRVSWTTDEPAIGFASFGKNTFYNNNSSVEPAFGLVHQVTIRDLAPGVLHHFRVRARDVAGNQAVSGDVVLTLSGATGSTDTAPPSVPAGLAATAASASQIGLSWVASTDNVDVAGYKVYRNGVQVGIVPANAYQDGGLAPSTAYTYAVAAFDAAGNVSARSANAGATTLAPQLEKVSALRSGLWSAGSTWSNGKPPSALSEVKISGTVMVEYDVPFDDNAAAEAASIAIDNGAVLRFSRTISTRLDLTGSLSVLSGGLLDIGSPQSPIPATLTAYLGFNVANDRLFASTTAVSPLPTDAAYHPEDTGLWITSGGKVTINGAPKPAIWYSLAQTANAGAATVTLSGLPTGFRIGDKIVITPSGRDAKEVEIRTIIAIAGNTLLLDAPLAYLHEAQRYALNTQTSVARAIAADVAPGPDETTVEVRSEVGLLTQNVVIASNLVKPGDTNHRAHTIFLHGSTGTFAYAEFRDLGPRAKKGRYPIHLHMTGGGSQYVVQGVSVWNQFEPGNKWVVLHMSRDAIVKDSVGYNAQGRGYYLEDGTEANNTIENNLGVGVYGPEEVPNHTAIDSLQQLTRPAVFWMRMNNTIRNNVAVGGDVDVSGYWITPAIVSGPATVFTGNEARGNAFGMYFSGGAEFNPELSGSRLIRNEIAVWSDSFVTPALRNTLFYGNRAVGIMPADASGSIITADPSAGTPTPPVGAPSLSLSASSASVKSGASVVLSWMAQSATECDASGDWLGAKPTSGSFTTAALSSAKTFGLICRNAAGAATGSVRVTIDTAPAFVAGNRIRVAAAAEVRAMPTTSIATIPGVTTANLLGTQAAGNAGSVIGGPKIADGATWWNIDFDSGADGWSTEPGLQADVPDTTAPGVPVGLTVRSVSSSQINLAWTRSTDNLAAGVVRFDILRNGVQVASTASNNYQDSGLNPNTSYGYMVRARDLAGNVSEASAVQAAATLAPSSVSPLDGIPAGTWHRAPNSRVGDIQFNWPSSIFLGSGQPRYMTESSGAYDTARQRFLLWGGGHNDYAGNEIYAFDLNTLAWRRETEPALHTDPKSTVEASGYYPDANGDVDLQQPRSRHTYDALQYVPPLDSLCAFGMMAGYPNSKGAFHTDCFNFSARRWEQKVDVPTAGQSIVAMSAYDPLSGHAFYLRGAGYLAEFDPLANTWTRRSANDAGYFYDATAIIDTKRNRFVAIGLQQLIYYDLNASGQLVQQRVADRLSGATDILKARRPGFAYDAANDVYVLWSGEFASSKNDGLMDVNLPPENVYVIDPDTWVAKAIVPAPGNVVKPRSPFALANGLSNSTFGRFAYLPSKNLFMLVNNRTDEDVFFYKLDPVQVRLALGR